MSDLPAVVAAVSAAVATSVVAASTTAAIATATAVSAAVTTASTTIASTTSAAIIFAWACFIYDHIAAVVFLAVKLSYRRSRIVVRSHFDKPEATRTSGLTVVNNIGRVYRSGGHKILLQIFARHAKRQISDVKFISHFPQLPKIMRSKKGGQTGYYKRNFRKGQRRVLLT